MQNLEVMHEPAALISLANRPVHEAPAGQLGGLSTDSRDPFPHGLGDELRSVVGPDVSGDASQDEEVGQNVDHIDRLELAGNTDRQAFMGELVEHVEHPILASIVGAVLDKVLSRSWLELKVA